MTTAQRKTVMVTGAARGIGQATAELLFEKGYRVILLDRDATSLEATLTGFVQAGFDEEDIETIVLDLANADAIESCIPMLRLLQDGLHGLVNNAAFERLKTMSEYSHEDFDQTWRINMLAPILMIRACYPFLQQANGSVVNVGSTSDIEHYREYSLYGASKAFLNAFSRHAAKELGFEGIRINIVSPGATETPLLQEMIDTGVFASDHILAAKQVIPMEQRFARSREVAETILMVLEGPRYMHGADLRLHGGAE